ncbi:hypothetical protein TURU_015434 [Turdus rufiventris]|nr:hypothetical protein TURU_015434 [Turdus rufiventris]
MGGSVLPSLWIGEEIITNWPEGENFGLTDDEEQEQVSRAEEAPLYNQLPADETRYALFTDGSCCIMGMNRKWKAATQQVAQATEGEGGSSQLAELKAVQLALDIAERVKWPKLYLYTDSWMVANALWGCLERWKKMPAPGIQGQVAEGSTLCLSILSPSSSARERSRMRALVLFEFIINLLFKEEVTPGLTQKYKALFQKKKNGKMIIQQIMIYIIHSMRGSHVI